MKPAAFASKCLAPYEVVGYDHVSGLELYPLETLSLKTDRPLANKRTCCGFSRLQARESETIVWRPPVYIYICIHTLLLSLVSLFSVVSFFVLSIYIYIYIYIYYIYYKAS